MTEGIIISDEDANEYREGILLLKKMGIILERKELEFKKLLLDISQAHNFYWSPYYKNGVICSAECLDGALTDKDVGQNNRIELTDNEDEGIRKMLFDISKMKIEYKIKVKDFELLRWKIEKQYHLDINRKWKIGHDKKIYYIQSGE